MANVANKNNENTKINLDQTSLAFHSGISFKMSYSKMIELVFSTLREMKLIWKRLNSDYIYKCHSGVSINNNEIFRNKHKYDEFNSKEMIKFFIQFSSVDNTKLATSIPITSEIKKEFRWSFIWIKGNCSKYLEFVTKFKQTIKQRIDMQL